ncbi:MAG: hypothetical protein DMF84_14560 [Acidobacteria bacterium]|nr:MAG: hypothetical protein DMF84_14560 [Acidobacteriota bacterium]
MSPKLLSSSLAAAFVFSLIVSAQAPAQQSAPSPTQQPTATSDQQKDATSPQSITVSGCVLKESSVLKKGALGTAGMGIGMGDEFVLTQAKLNESKTATEKPEAQATAAQPNEPAGTAGTGNNFGKVYRLTGEKENDLKNYVGQRVEIVGMFKHQEDAKAEAAAVGTSGRELTAANTPEITITSIIPSTGSCSVPAVK